MALLAALVPLSISAVARGGAAFADDALWASADPGSSALRWVSPPLGGEFNSALERATFAAPIAQEAPGSQFNFSRPETVTLPPAPSSAVFMLCALGGLGAWQLGSSARKWHWNAAPDWFATNGPQQIGHATIIDLSFTFTPVYPNAELRIRMPVWRCVSLFFGPALSRQAVLEVVAPRGPPASR